MLDYMVESPENIVEKGVDAANQLSLLFKQCFQKLSF